MTCLMATGETHIIVLTVDSNVLLVALAETLNSGLNRLDTTFVTHSLRREVCVTASTIPLTWHSLRVHRNAHTPIFSNAVQEETSHRQMVTHLNAFAWTNLELPLRRHHFRIDTRVVDTSVKTRTVVSFNDVATNHTARSDTTVVRALRTREAAYRPAKRPTIGTHERVLLLNTEPAMLILALLEDLDSIVTEVGLVRSAVIVVTFGKDQDVIATTEWIREISNRA